METKIILGLLGLGGILIAFGINRLNNNKQGFAGLLLMLGAYSLGISYIITTV